MYTLVLDSFVSRGCDLTAEILYVRFGMGWSRFVQKYIVAIF